MGDRMENMRRYPDKVRVICDQNGLIERVHIGGIEPVPEPEVEYVRADQLQGAVAAVNEARAILLARRSPSGQIPLAAEPAERVLALLRSVDGGGSSHG